MSNIRFGLEQDFPRSRILKNGNGKSIDDMNSCGNSIGLIRWWQLRVRKQSESTLNYVPMLSLNHPILLRCVRTWKLVNKTMCWTEILKGIRSKLSTIICSQNFDFRIQLILYNCFKELKNIKKIKFMFKKINPSKFGILINKKNIILKII